jgi:hypothetical protein
VADAQGVRVLGAQDPLHDRQQRDVLIAGGGRIPRLPGPTGELVPDGQGVRVLGAEDPLADGQQRGEQVAGGGRIPRLSGPAGEVDGTRSRFCAVRSPLPSRTGPTVR